MKIKYIWEESDIQPGRYIIRESYPKGCTDIGGMASVTEKIGWMNKARSGEPKFTTISIMDGMVMGPMTAEDLLKSLNEDDHGYRPATNKELLDMMRYLKGQNEGTPHA